MTHREKVRWMMDDLKRRGVPAGTSAPWLFRLLWGGGIPLRPPLFLPTATLFAYFTLVSAVWISLLALVSIGVSVGRVPLSSIWFSVPRGLLGGALVGFCLTMSTRSQKRRLGLPPWERYGPVEQAEEVFS